MKLLQLNVWDGRLELPLSQLLKTEQPDIICLQESINFPRQTGGFLLPVEEMLNLLPGSEAFTSPTMSFSLFNDTANRGNTIISKLPFTDQQTIFTNLSFKPNFEEARDDFNIRNLQHATFDVKGQTLHVLNHHGFFVPNTKNGNEITWRQCQIIADYLDELDGPIILAGDFNLVPHSRSLKLINSRLHNLSLSHNLKTTFSDLSPKSDVCDYIFVSDNVKVKTFRASNELVSDHKALIMEFEI